LTIFEQIAAYCVSAFSSGVMTFRWWQMSEERRQRGWWLYGWFCGLMLLGSCVGAVTWSAWMRVIRAVYLVFEQSSKDPAGFAVDAWWNAVFRVSYAIEFLCLSVALLMVLDRMSEKTGGNWLSKRWTIGRRIVLAAVVAGNLVGLAGNVVAAVHFDQAAKAAIAASALFAANSTFDSSEYYLLYRTEYRLALSTSSVQAHSEVAVLLLIILAFVTVGVACVRHVSYALSLLSAAGPGMAAAMGLRHRVVGAATALGRQLRQEIVGTTAVVFLTFLVRSGFSFFFGLAFALQESDKRCEQDKRENVCVSSCRNIETKLAFWMYYTPQFQLIIVLISMPLPLLVALWSTTKGKVLQQMRVNEQELASVRVGVLNSATTM
jgi:hypothetical protein